DLELEADVGGAAYVRPGRLRDDLGPAVDPHDAQPPIAPPGPVEKRHRDVAAARAHVEQGQLDAVRGQRLDRRGAQAGPAQPPVDPPQVAQVAGQRGRVVERAVEQLDGVGETLHETGVGPWNAG